MSLERHRDGGKTGDSRGGGRDEEKRVLKSLVTAPTTEQSFVPHLLGADSSHDSAYGARDRVDYIPASPKGGWVCTSWLPADHAGSRGGAAASCECVDGIPTSAFLVEWSELVEQKQRLAALGGPRSSQQAGEREPGAVPDSGMVASGAFHWRGHVASIFSAECRVAH